MKLKRLWAVALPRLVRILQRSSDLRKAQELEVVMRHWHKEETIALAKWEEALECENWERAGMWEARCKEARQRCNDDFRRPMIELTGKQNLFDANACALAQPGRKTHLTRPTIYEN